MNFCLFQKGRGSNLAQATGVSLSLTKAEMNRVFLQCNLHVFNLFKMTVLGWWVEEEICFANIRLPQLFGN